MLPLLPLNMRAPHGYRAAVRELREDAQALETWRPAGFVVRPERTVPKGLPGDGGIYLPNVGDLLVSTRPGGLHVERVTEAHPRFPVTIGANEENRWIERQDVDLLGPKYLGAIAYPAELGAAAVAFARSEMRRPVREAPGPDAHPQIRAYHAGARRGGGPLAGMPGCDFWGGLPTLGRNAPDEIPWCASAASWCCWMALGGGR